MAEGEGGSGKLACEGRKRSSGTHRVVLLMSSPLLEEGVKEVRRWEADDSDAGASEAFYLGGKAPPCSGLRFTIFRVMT